MARVGSFEISEIHVPGWRLVKPILLGIYSDASMPWMVADDVFSMYGLGASRDEALRDYETVLTEYYEIMEQDKADPPTGATFACLQTYLQRV